jgi:sigma-B regulation protein RsbU (phosphoserine phosphatase)
VAGILVATGLLTYATIRYQFLDVRLIFRQSFVYTISSGLIVGVYIFIVLESQEVLQPIVGDQARVLAYVLIIFLLLVFQPINNWIDNMIRSMFIRTRTDHRNVIERFSRQVISLFDPIQLRLIIEETLKTALLVERVYFVLYDDKIGEYVLLASDDFARRTILQRDDLMLRGINLLDTPSFMHSLSDYAKDSKLADHLKQRGVRLVLPMKDAKHLLGFLALTGKAAGYRYSSEDLNLLGVLSNTMVSALTNARLYVESLERVRLQEEVSMARQIQLDLLPSSPPQVEGVAISVHATPSRTVGGDFYDFVQIDDKHLGVVIADASGKGMPAALMIAQIQAIVHSEVNNGNEIARMIANMNRIMYTALSSEKYVTLFYGVFNFEEKTFNYVNAGHNYPLLVHADGNCEELKIGGPIIGALPGMVYTSAQVELCQEDLLFFFTDGLSEAMDSAEREYGEERVREFVCSHREHDPASLVELILSDVRAHDPSDPPADDTTIIAVKLSALTGQGDQAHDLRREEAVRPKE